MENWSYYHPYISRIECERLLRNKKNGSFLIRNSESTVSDHVLSISWNGNTHHFKIKRREHGMFLECAVGVEQYYFDTFDKLVSYYQIPNRGLQYTLGEPVVNQDFLSADEKDDEDDDDSDLSDSDDNNISLFFQQQLDIVSGLRSDLPLKEMLEEYAQKGVGKDFQHLKSGSSTPAMLQELLVKAAGDLHVSLQNFLNRLHRIQEFFDVGTNVEMDSGSPEKSSSVRKDSCSHHQDLEYVFKMLSECKSSMLNVEKKACRVLTEYGGLSTNESPEAKTSKNTELEYSVLKFDNKTTATEQKLTLSKKQIFEVTSGALKNKSYISLDVKQGKIIFSKTLDVTDSSSSFSSDQVHQLVKSKTSKVKLGIMLENASNLKNYNFENHKSRELFCSIIQQMKIAHSKDIPQSSQLSVFIGTWNMGDAAANDITEWFHCMGSGKTKVHDLANIPSDIYAIGTQETAYHEKEWVNKLKAALLAVFKKEFKLVTCYSMWDIRIVVFIKPELYNLVSSLKQSSVKTGIANALGNKGAVGVSFLITSTSFCFVNCHLTSGNEKLIRRNQNYHSILRGLNLGQTNAFDVTLSFHHLFWFGDLNYRLDLEVTDIIKSIMESDWQKLIASDQLAVEMKKGNAFVDFREEDISFPPTYRYTRGTRSTYCWTKVKRTGNRTNVPSWCDRVLWRSYPELTSCNTTYGCTDTICSSDHSAVYATFDVGVISQKLANNNEYTTELQNTDHSVKITIYSAEAKVLTSSTTKFLLEFHSSCLEKTIISRKNSCVDFGRKHDSLFRGSNLIDGKSSYSYPWWTKNDLVELKPVLADPNYLEEQHVLVAVKGEDGQESYGETVVALKILLSGEPISCEYKLTHFGVEAGSLKLALQMMTPSDFKYQPSIPKSKVYDFIKIEEEQSTELKNVPKNKEQQMHLVKFPVDRSSIQQVDPVDKTFELTELSRPQSLGFDNSVVKYIPVDDDEQPLLPPKLKTKTRPMSQKDNSHSTLSNPSSPTHFTDESAPLMEFQISKTLPRRLPSEYDNPVPKPRTKKKVKHALNFQSWLSSIGHEEYFELLVSNGFDDLDFFCSVAEDDLVEIGITNEVHRNDIVSQAKKLKKPNKSLVQV